MRSITILGSTGSIGTQALDVVRRHPERFKIVGLSAAGMNQDLLVGQAREFLPPLIAIADEEAAADVKSKLGPVRDVDDCVARLRSKSRASRISAIKWIGEKQSFPDPQEKKKIIDALGPLTEDGADPLLKKDAVFWKLALELDP